MRQVLRTCGGLDELTLEPMAEECVFEQYPARSSVTLVRVIDAQPVGG